MTDPSQQVACNHASPYCWFKGCEHSLPHTPGVKSLNGLNMGDCTDPKNERVCCVTGAPMRVTCGVVKETT